MKNAPARGRGASDVVGRYPNASSPSRPRLQANAEMRSRVAWYRWTSLDNPKLSVVLPGPDRREERDD